VHLSILGGAFINNLILLILGKTTKIYHFQIKITKIYQFEKKITKIYHSHNQAKPSQQLQLNNSRS
jgi:hypothetical protein